jgi:hypothetical protein
MIQLSISVVSPILIRLFGRWSVKRPRRLPRPAAAPRARVSVILVRQKGKGQRAKGKGKREKGKGRREKGNIMGPTRTGALLILAVCCGLVAASWTARAQAGDPPRWAVKDLRAGIIGTDTSHVPNFTKILHSRPEWKVRVVAAYKGGSPDLPLSPIQFAPKTSH